MKRFRSALFIHGAGGGGWEWNLWRGVFQANGFLTRTPDSQPVPAGLAATCFGDYETQMRCALSSLPVPRAVVGASLGGLLALRIADLADAAVLVNPLPPAPWHRALPARDWPETVPWRSAARLASTRDAMPDSDEATVLFAFRRWRDESGAVLRDAYAGLDTRVPRCRVLFVSSRRDDEVPPSLSASIARTWHAEIMETAIDGHVAPLLGRVAPVVARQTVAWLNGRESVGGIQSVFTASP